MQKLGQIKQIALAFLRPLIILTGIGVYFLLHVFELETAGQGLLLGLILLGSYDLFSEIVASLIKKKFALDYIALAAIIISLVTQEWVVGAVIALMLATGQNLEHYAAQTAKKTLTALVDRIPSDVLRWENGGIGSKASIQEISVGDMIYIRKGEVIPLDGELVSEATVSDESSLTGEPYLFEKFSGDLMRSGTINMGEPIVVQVTKAEADSTYRKIINMVHQAQEEKAPLVRLADRYSTFFTLITLFICLITFAFTRDWQRILAVLVIATPCPLILATPIALMGGMSASAKRRIIVKKLATLEVLSRITSIVFDKTGTITMGRPSLSRIEVAEGYTEDDILALAAAGERSSLHPLAKAIVEQAQQKKVPIHHAKNIKEAIGKGLMMNIDGQTYTLNKPKEGHGMAIEMRKGEDETGERMGTFYFEDQIKEDTVQTLKTLHGMGLNAHMFTGDKKAAAEAIAQKLDSGLTVQAECSPEDKQNGIKLLKEKGYITAMVGDGINDAPALALADVGMVFSNEEQTASSEAADMVFLGGDFTLVLESIHIARRTVHIAIQSILWGIGLSIAGMLLASIGLIAPIVGAILQELIDLTSILNSLRASR